MEKNEEAANQLESEVIEQDATELDNTAEGSEEKTAEEIFLDVDERTKFKNKEAAIEAYKNAGQRIAQLSAWEKEVAQAYGITDPKMIVELLDELAERRQADEGKKESKSAPKSAAEVAKASDAELTPEQRAAKDWFRQTAEEMGYVSKSLLKELQDKLDAVTGRMEQDDESRRQYAIEAGQSHLRSLLAKNELKVDEEGYETIENTVAAWIDSDPKRAKLFIAGGSASLKLVEEGFQRVSKLMNHAKAAGAKGTVETKTAKANATPKPLPKGGVPAVKKEEVKSDGKGITPKIHELAWEHFQKSRQS